ncbi:MAG: MlaD family protein, partial [Desulfuromonadales bacterium]|nr:MlaD family protein [Desulfuromonadales bacterium]
VVPIVALLIGGWLAFKAMSEKGPEISITFETAEGLEAGKTKIKFKDVEVGIVTDIVLREDLSGVVVTAEINKNSEQYVTDKTRFWVVRARVAAGEVSGLGTLFSGAYIGCNPSTQGERTKEFTGLEKPPVVTAGMPGRHFVLEADHLGSLDVSSPVYYRGIEVGQVVEYDFDNTAEAVDIRVFIHAPYHEKVRQNTRFWNASGIDFSLDTEGVAINTQSLVSIMLGGVAFDLPEHLDPVAVAEEDQEFDLYADYESIQEKSYNVRRYYMMYFDQSVRGLAPGAPVEIRGIKLGEVVDVKLEVNADDLSVQVPVLVMIEPERIDLVVENDVVTSGAENIADEDESRDNMRRLVAKGLRAQLKPGNLLTGQLFVDLDFHQELEAEPISMVDGHMVFPTVPAPLDRIVQRVDNILKKFEKIPFAKIGRDLNQAIVSLTGALDEVKSMSGAVSQETLPRINTALDDLQGALKGVESTLGPDSAFNYNARKVTDELASTVRSIRSLLDYLERDPQALIFGKEGETE